MVEIRNTSSEDLVVIRDKYGKIINEQIFVIARSGWGKEIACEGMAESFWKQGYVVIVIADPKRELEYAFQMFPAMERYHLDNLSRIGKKPEGKPVKVYHPFSFSIPRDTLLPPINFYTLPLKEMIRKDWSLIAETESETESITLLQDASKIISKEDGIYGFVNAVQSLVEGRKNGREKKADPNNFFVKSGAGTQKSISEITNYLRQFKNDYFLSKQTCPLNLNWKELLNDQEHYHVFTSYWIKEEKIRDFCVSTILNGILTNKQYLKKPILLIIPEIKTLVPFRPEGHKKFLANSIKDSLSMTRSSGRGMATISNTQSFSEVDESVRKMATTTWLGEINGDDIEKLSKIFSYKREIKDKLKNMEYKNSFFLIGKEDFGTYTIMFSSSANKEPDYNFFEMYRKYFSDKLVKYNDTIDIMKKISEDETEKYREKIKREEKQEKEERDKLAKEKEQNSSIGKEVAKVKTKLNEVKEKSKEEKMIQIYNCKRDYTEASWREIGRKCSVDSKTSKKYFEDYSKILEERENLPKINGAIVPGESISDEE